MWSAALRPTRIRRAGDSFERTCLSRGDEDPELAAYCPECAPSEFE
jgi:hypothetical protein